MAGRSPLPFAREPLVSPHPQGWPFSLRPHLSRLLQKHECAESLQKHAQPTSTRAKRERVAQISSVSLQIQLAYPKFEAAQFEPLSRHFSFSTQRSIRRLRWLEGRVSIRCRCLRASPPSSACYAFELEEHSATDFGHVTVDVTINGLMVLVRQQR